MPPRPELAAARRVVVKVGTGVLTHPDGRPALARLFGVIEGVATAHAAGIEVLLVSSGAVGMGLDALGLDHAPVDLADRQACAAVGQGRLLGLYVEGFARLHVVAGQVLLTEGDLDDRVRYLNLRSTLGALLRRRVVPILNENDTVSTEELAFVEGATRPVFGDNDKLSALVAAKLDADALVILTDVDGVHDVDPRHHPDSERLHRIEAEDAAAIEAGLVAGAGSDLARGGMRSKIAAARIAQAAGCQVVVASGLVPSTIGSVLAGEDVGTWFPATSGPSARRRWIGHATAPRGTLHLDDGAVGALRERGASLLAVGVNRVEGAFRQGDVVAIVGPGGERVGRGLVFCDSETARRWAAGQQPDGVRNHDALVHRDNLALDEP